MGCGLWVVGCGMKGECLWVVGYCRFVGGGERLCEVNKYCEVDGLRIKEGGMTPWRGCGVERAWQGKGLSGVGVQRTARSIQAAVVRSIMPLR